MGCFYTNVIIRSINERSRSVVANDVLVDTGSEATWISRKLLAQLGITIEVKDRAYQMANGQQITRSIGYAILETDSGFRTVDEIVFAEEGDHHLLGARTLEGFNARVDPTNKRLVAAGPIPAA